MTKARQAAPAPIYIADCMLGRLAKWLRVLGYDVVYDRRISDDDLITRARREGRVLLTRDTRLVQRRLAGEHMLIASDDPEEQLAQMVKDCGLELAPERFLSRCLRCNEATVKADREAVKELVPPYVFQTQRTFSQCAGCGRIYWRATHVDGILERLRRRLGESFTAP